MRTLFRMKMLFRVLMFVAMVMLMGVCLAFGAETAATVATTQVTFLGWIAANKAAIFIVLLAISEFLALIPGISGNGILDAIIKSLKILTGKTG